MPICFKSYTTFLTLASNLVKFSKCMGLTHQLIANTLSHFKWATTFTGLPGLHDKTHLKANQNIQLIKVIQHIHSLINQHEPEVTTNSPIFTQLVNLYWFMLTLEFHNVILKLAHGNVRSETNVVKKINAENEKLSYIVEWNWKKKPFHNVILI